MSSVLLQNEYEYEDENVLNRNIAIFQKTILHDKVHLQCTQLTRDFASHILTFLKSKYGGVCSKYGYVLTQSIRLRHIGNVIVQMGHLNGDVCVDVAFDAHVCNPDIGSSFQGKVSAVNRFGIMIRSGPVECIVTKSPVTAALTSEIDVQDVAIGDLVHVKILGKRFEIGDVVISAVGKLIVPRNISNNNNWNDDADSEIRDVDTEEQHAEKTDEYDDDDEEGNSEEENEEEENEEEENEDEENEDEEIDNKTEDRGDNDADENENDKSSVSDDMDIDELQEEGEDDLPNEEDIDDDVDDNDIDNTFMDEYEYN